MLFGQHQLERHTPVAVVYGVLFRTAVGFEVSLTYVASSARAGLGSNGPSCGAGTRNTHGAPLEPEAVDLTVAVGTTDVEVQASHSRVLPPRRHLEEGCRGKD